MVLKKEALILTLHGVPCCDPSYFLVLRNAFKSMRSLAPPLSSFLIVIKFEARIVQRLMVRSFIDFTVVLGKVWVNLIKY